MKCLKKTHCLQESNFKLSEQLKLRRKTIAKGVISFDETQLEIENKVLKEKSWGNFQNI